MTTAASVLPEKLRHKTPVAEALLITAYFRETLGPDVATDLARDILKAAGYDIHPSRVAALFNRAARSFEAATVAAQFIGLPGAAGGGNALEHIAEARWSIEALLRETS